MTCIEKYEKKFPGEPRPHLAHCPHEFGWAEYPGVKECSVGNCTACWEREAVDAKPAGFISKDPNKVVERALTHKAYELLVAYRDDADGAGVDIDEVIGYLGQALDDHNNTAIIDGTKIIDSGDRTEFPSGAVRDMREGKGNFAVMPLEVIRDFLNDEIIGYIANFMQTRDTSELYQALDAFSDNFGNEYTLLLETAVHFEQGAKKYGPDNWRRGIPVECYIDSAVRHYIKWLRGDTCERHDRAFCWNIMCCIWEVDYHKEDTNA